MSKARNLADSADVSQTDNLDSGSIDSIGESNVYNSIETTADQVFDGGTV